MAKDPAFLFYSKDWLEGTAEMSSEEKGAYIDLLAHQHQKGSLPSEPKKLAKLCGLSESEFLKIWGELSSKFIANATGRMVNRKLNGIVSERLDKGWRNTIIGYLGATIRYAVQNEGKNAAVAEKVKKTFKVDDFLACAKENVGERISEWFSERYDKCYKSIANGNANKDETENKIESSYSVETNGAQSLISKMIEIWVKKFPSYTRQKENDSQALRVIADFIFINSGISNGYGDVDQEIKVLNIFEHIANQVNKETFWVNKSLKSIASHIQEFYNKIKNPTNGTYQQQSIRNSKSAGAQQAVASLKDDIKFDS